MNHSITAARTLTPVRGPGGRVATPTVYFVDVASSKIYMECGLTPPRSLAPPTPPPPTDDHRAPLLRRHRTARDNAAGAPIFASLWWQNRPHVAMGVG